MKFVPTLLAGFLIVSTANVAFAADSVQPVVSDSRVKTFVYNENEVYPIYTQYGYQTGIEFSKSEEIQTISLGDRVGWQVIPSGRRIFIQTLQDDSQTNLTVVTDRRTYQFDLKSIGNASGNEGRLVYIARFYYPEDGWVSGDTASPAAPMSSNIQPAAFPVAPMAQPAPSSPLNQPVSVPVDANAKNYNYTFSGSDVAAPIKIFDDGNSTYFQFKDNRNSPSIRVIGAANNEIPVNVTRQGEYWVAPVVAAKFSVRNNGQMVCVFNEQVSRTQ